MVFSFFPRDISESYVPSVFMAGSMRIRFSSPDTSMVTPLFVTVTVSYSFL